MTIDGSSVVGLRLVYHQPDLLNGRSRVARAGLLARLAALTVEEDPKGGAFDVKGSVS
jgi:hypothetical protein